MPGTRPHRLLFVCTANICRSPMAEALARHHARERGLPLETKSGGVMGIEGRPADAMAVRVLSEIGVDLSRHKSSGLDAEKVEWADYILVMELDHARRVREEWPDVEDRILMLGNFGGLVDVSDPMGGWRWRFRKTRDDLVRCIEGFMDKLPPPPAADETVTG
jgi:protein-tyrosine-phosphatase